MKKSKAEDRFVSFDDITSRAKEEIRKGFRGQAVIGFVDLLGFSDKIRNEWNDEKNNPLQTLMEMKVFFHLAVEKTNNEIILYDYEGEVLRTNEWPEIITVSDSFMFLKPINDSSEENILLSIFSVISATLELWQIAIDKGFSIRGGIDYGDVFYHKLDIVGEPFMDAYILESKIAKSSRTILSDNIRKLIKENLTNINPVILHYFQRFLNKEDDGFLSVNPLMILGHNAKALENTMNKLNEMLDGVTSEKIINKYKGLYDTLRAQDFELTDISMFDK
mgnify:CR=1 FL=1